MKVPTDDVLGLLRCMVLVMARMAPMVPPAAEDGTGSSGDAETGIVTGGVGESWGAVQEEGANHH